MFAVIKTGGKQYKVAAEDVLTIERLPGTAGDTITFDEVLLVHDGEATHVGSPRVAGACVAATLVEQARGDKVIAFKKRRRQNSRRKRGHRQDLTTVKIMEILTGGKRPAMASSKAAVAAHDNAGIAATAAAGLAAAKAAGIDTNKFQRLSAAVGDHDNLELIGGIGPTIAKKLNALGIWHFWQVVAMTQEDIDSVEHDVGFKGRATRDHWKDQAAELMAGKGPRAKSDQAALAAQHHD